MTITTSTAPDFAPSPPMLPEYALLVDAKEAANLCRLGLSTWWRFVAGGKTPAPVRIGRAVRWRRDELLAWVDAGCPARSRWESLWPSGGRRGTHNRRDR